MQNFIISNLNVNSLNPCKNIQDNEYFGMKPLGLSQNFKPTKLNKIAIVFISITYDKYKYKTKALPVENNYAEKSKCIGIFPFIEIENTSLNFGLSRRCLTIENKSFDEQIKNGQHERKIVHLKKEFNGNAMTYSKQIMCILEGFPFQLKAKIKIKNLKLNSIWEYLKGKTSFLIECIYIKAPKTCETYIFLLIPYNKKCDNTIVDVQEYDNNIMYVQQFENQLPINFLLIDSHKCDDFIQGQVVVKKSTIIQLELELNILKVNKLYDSTNYFYLIL